MEFNDVVARKADEMGLTTKALAIATLTALAAILAGCSKAPPPQNNTATLNRELTCKEPLPTFTLGPNSDPTDAQVATLCACIWDNLDQWERETSKLIAEKKESEASSVNLRAFPSRFGAALEKCGGMKL